MPRGEGIKPINKLFDKYKNTLVAPERSVKQAFCEVVSDLLHFSIKEGELNYSTTNKTLSLRVSGPKKTEILLQKKEILTHMQGRLGPKNSPKQII